LAINGHVDVLNRAIVTEDLTNVSLIDILGELFHHNLIRVSQGNCSAMSRHEPLNSAAEDLPGSHSDYSFCPALEHSEQDCVSAIVMDFYRQPAGCRCAELGSVFVEETATKSARLNEE
jgi:hypothetical protein